MSFSTKRNSAEVIMPTQKIHAILDELGHFVLGKKRQLEYALACLLAKGHLLVEDVPGVGKTTLAKSLAGCIQAKFNRIQFTSDLLPSDLIGVTVFHQTTSQFEFNKGPIFANVLLADEINRANPKTQSALLEAMHDAQVSHDGITMPLPTPFFVLATQNSKDHHGTFPLPESQLDRFLMRIHLGYPSPSLEKRVFQGDYLQERESEPRMGLKDLMQLQNRVISTHVSTEVLDFIYQIVHGSRKHTGIRVGVSPRGGQAMYRACQSLALIRGRDFVIPDDVVELTPMVFPHRVILEHNQVRSYRKPEDAAPEIFREILAALKVPV